MKQVESPHNGVCDNGGADTGHENHHGFIDYHDNKDAKSFNAEKQTFLGTEDDDKGVVETEDRETWGKKIDFILALVGFSVGLGNVWRFPYLCYKNGGGAFLIPYLICVVIGALPLVILEVSLGQFMSKGGVKAWAICPLFQGIGWATTTVAFMVNCYYVVILVWAFFYFFCSFTTKLPWDSCHNDWNTINCNDKYLFALSPDVNNTTPVNIDNTMLTAHYNTSSADNGLMLTENMTMLQDSNNASSVVLESFSNGYLNTGMYKKVDPVTEFWENRVLAISDGIEDMGPVKWDLCLCLLLSWIIVFFCISKGVKTSGKVVYFTATAPYALLLVLLIRGCMLPGAKDGIIFYLVPDFKKLATMQVWVDAGSQVFISYVIGLGGLTALGSYNTWNHNSYRDSIVFACINSGTSVFAGFVIFSVLGFMANEMGVTVDKVAESGPGLAFVVYPKAISQMPIAPLWSALFFFTLILMGLDSEFVSVEGFVTAVLDTFPMLRKSQARKTGFVAVSVFVHFLIGISMCTQGGMYVFQLFDYYPASRIVVLIGFLECITVAWIYGVNRYYDNLEMMFGFRINAYMKVCWLVFTPLYCMVLFIMSGVNYSVLTYERPHHTYIYPNWAVWIGWCLSIIPAIAIIVTAVYKAVEFQRNGKPLKALLKPEGFLPHQLRPQDQVKIIHLSSKQCHEI